MRSSDRRAKNYWRGEASGWSSELFVLSKTEDMVYKWSTRRDGPHDLRPLLYLYAYAGEQNTHSLPPFILLPYLPSPYLPTFSFSNPSSPIAKSLTPDSILASLLQLIECFQSLLIYFCLALRSRSTRNIARRHANFGNDEGKSSKLVCH